MVLPGVVVSRFVYEVSSDSGLPPRIFACAMMLYHAFVEYVSEEGSLLDADFIMVGITSLVLSLKFNENYLNTVIEQVNDPVPSKSRSMKVIDSAARAIVSYGQSHNAKGLTTEQLVQVKEKIKAGVCELSMLRIFGNFSTSIPVVPGTDSMAPLDLVREYSSPQCLRRWA